MVQPTMTIGTPEYKELIDRISSIPIEEWKSRFFSFLSLNFDAISYDEIQKEWEKRDLMYPIYGLPLTKFNEFSIWRVRKANKVSFPNDLYLDQTFSYPPAGVTGIGRANRQGLPVFYGSFSRDTAILESKLKEGEYVYLSEWKFNENSVSSFKYHPFFHVNSTSVFADVSKSFLKSQEAGAKGWIEHFKVVNDSLGQLFLEKAYKVTSWMSHNLLFENPEIMDAIMYPSIAKDHNGMNVAIHPNFVNTCMKLKGVYLVKYEDRGNWDYYMYLSGLAKKIGNGLNWYNADNITRDMAKEFYGSDDMRRHS